MIIAWNWLENFVDLSSYHPKDIAEILTQRGLEVEGVEGGDALLDDLVVARITQILPHPKADALKLVDVDLGNAKTLRVVCGAPGIEVGWHVPFAAVGTKVGDLLIKEVRIRGELSQGMLCSERELGISDDHESLCRFSPKSVPGMSVAEAIKIDVPAQCFWSAGARLNVSLTPDRGDCLSHKGLARELASGLRRKPKNVELATWDSKLKADIVEVQNDEDCPRYLALEIDGIVVGPSPAWLRRAVEAAGARSINNVVDVTNFVCFELGQPMHAFDRDKLSGSKIMVRRAKAGEKIVAINHVEYSLSVDDIAICDQSGPQAIAGVMGGAHTEVSESTSKILLEIASFSASSVRKTAKRLGLHSESSHRFERGTDAASLIIVARRALELLALSQVQPLKVVAYDDSAAKCFDAALAMEQGIWSNDMPLSVLAQKGEECRLKPKEISLRLHRVNQILGTSLKPQSVRSILTRVGFMVDISDESVARVVVPMHRNDVEREIDVIEEIARDLGFDQIPAVLPHVAMQCSHQELSNTPYQGSFSLKPTIWSRDARQRQEQMRRNLMNAGLMECMHYSFMDPEDPKRLGFSPDAKQSQLLHLANPMTVEQSCMRTSLLPAMLRALKLNMSRQQESVAFFELGSVFFAKSQEKFVEAEENEHLCILLWGKEADQWDAKAKPYDIYDLKGIIEALANAMQWPIEFRQDSEYASYLHDGVQARIVYDGKTIGFLGELHPRLAKHYKVEDKIFVAEFDLSSLNLLAAGIEQCRPLPRFPRSTRDLSLLIADDVSYAKIAEIIEANKPDTLEYWELFDVYRGKQVAEGMQSISLSFAYRDPLASDPEKGHTLTDEEVSAAHEQMRVALEKALGAQLRA
ncbi:MAG: phenylalanine--tRNA ligase subunit beta [Bradymonadales bacterium]|jgi:phenylalanyl-tRNA synthetase beta chain